jgi:tetratricopeptide (TPR) repeat protein
MTTRCLAIAVTMVWVVAGLPARIHGQAPAPSRILVMPFDNVTREASIFWLGEASAVLLADNLNAIGASAIARDERREAFEQLQVPPNATLTAATVIRIGQLVGAAEVITGSVQLEADTLIVHARGIALESGRISHDIVDRGPASEMFQTFDRIARQFASPTRASSSGDRRVPPLAAFENYIKGLLAETPTIAVNFLNAALSAQPTFDRARLALWDVYADQGDHARALAAVTPVPAGSEWSRRASFLAGLSYLNLKKYDEAFSAFKSVADGQPSASALNNIGIVQIRRGATPQTGQPAYYFNKAAEVDPNDPDYFFNLGYSFWLAKDYQACIYWLKEAVRRNPADGDAHFVLGAALAVGGSPVEAARERELARRLSSTYEQWEKRPAAEAVPKGLERVKGGVELPHQHVEAAFASNEQRDQRELARFYLDRGRRLFQTENDREAIAELNRAIYLSPYEAEAHLLVGRIHLRNSRVREAIDAFKISLWSSESVPAHLALGDAYLQMKDVDAAKVEAERALSLEPASSEARQLLSRVGAAR